MLRKLLFTLGIILSANLLVFSQSGALKGKVLDKATREPLPFVNIVVEVGGTNVSGSASDFDGNYMIKPIPPGKYDVKATYVAYNVQGRNHCRRSDPVPRHRDGIDSAAARDVRSD